MDRLWEREVTYHRGGKQIRIHSDLYPMSAEKRSRIREEGRNELVRLFERTKTKTVTKSGQIRQEWDVRDV